jgi:predicted dienelactone hydrolase
MGKVAAVAVALLVLIGSASGAVAILRTGHPVGFQLVSITNPGVPPLQVGIWYPTAAARRPMRLGLVVQEVARDAPAAGDRLPLVVISHGNQGAVTSHADTALALADAGFVVAAPLHTGDNFADQSIVGGPKLFADRSRHVVLTIDYLLQGWPAHAKIDARRIGIFGFSAGGTTALIAIGGNPDFKHLAEYCLKAPEPACTLWRSPEEDAVLVHDARARAAVIVAPGFGFAFVPGGLKNVTVPVQLWNGEADQTVPVASNAAPIAAALGGNVEFHLVPHAQHFSFLVPCGADGPQIICSDGPDFDREAFHRRFNAAVVAFFRSRL